MLPSRILPIFFLVPAVAASVFGQEKADPKALAAKAIAAAGGEAKLFTLFRIEERFNFGETEAAPEKSSKRKSVIEPPLYWWVGGKERGDEPAKSDVWAWSLGVLTDGKSILEAIPGATEGGKTTLALRVSGSVTPAMDLHFDPDTHRLARLDWKNDIYRFSDWREVDGAGYQARTTIFKKNTGKAWFYHEITQIERLAALPEGLSRK